MTKDQVFEKVASILTSYLRLQAGEVTAESHVMQDLGADSLALVELGFKFSEAFGIGMLDPTADSLVVGTLVDKIVEQRAQITAP